MPFIPLLPIPVPSDWQPWAGVLLGLVAVASTVVVIALAVRALRGMRDDDSDEPR